jgi:hypothetical protein
LWTTGRSADYDGLAEIGGWSTLSLRTAAGPPIGETGDTLAGGIVGFHHENRL